MNLYFAIAIVCTATQITSGQVPSPAAGFSAPSFSTSTSLVLVPSLIRNRAGELVYSLTASDFELSDDGHVQKLRLDEDTNEEPLALFVIIEVGGAAAPHLYTLKPILSMLFELQHHGAECRRVLKFHKSPITHLWQCMHIGVATTLLGHICDLHQLTRGASIFK